VGLALLSAWTQFSSWKAVVSVPLLFGAACRNGPKRTLAHILGPIAL
jgi:hypothetical protein